MGEAVKGLERVIRLLPHFKNLSVLVVSRSNMDFYRSLAKTLDIEKQVIFVGFLGNPEVAYKAADMFVYPSPYDPFGMVVTEAMSSELAVVVSRHIGAAELIQHGTSGLLCDHDSQDSILESVSTLLKNDGTRLTLGKAARRSIAEVSWDHCAEKTFEVYRSVYERKRPLNR